MRSINDGSDRNEEFLKANQQRDVYLVTCSGIR